MKKKFTQIYFLLLFISASLIAKQATAQSCPSLSLTYTSSDSRCMSTGSITATATGGSGNYNYKVDGQMSTPFTSSNVITGLQAGSYQLTVKDVSTECQFTINATVGGSYTDPRFQLTKTDITCIGSNGTIAISNRQFGLAPFVYTIVSPSPSQVGTTNSTGMFSGLSAGEYSIQLQDSCGGIQVRRITIEDYSWTFDNNTVTKVGCDSADVVVNLRDSKGNVNSSGNEFNGYTYAVVRAPGDTTWSLSRSFRVFLGTNRSVTILAKDNCGNIHTTVWNVPPNTMPSVHTNTVISDKTCSYYTATITGQTNFINPAYCLYDNNNVLLRCELTPIFDSLSYDVSYCIKIRDLCYDTTINRCFNTPKPKPMVTGSTVTITNRACSTVTAAITGLSNLTKPFYCLFNSSNVQIACDSTGVFPNIPYGSYTISIKDGCVDTTLFRTFTVGRLRPVINGVARTGADCNTFDAAPTSVSNPIGTTQFCLYDDEGNVITCNTTGLFSDLPHGNYCMIAVTSCGDTSTQVCFTGGPPVPFINTLVQISNQECAGYTATITGQANWLTTPQYCLYNELNVQVACNTSGIFNNIPYDKNYCITVHGGCNDTTITRCFNQPHPVPAINGSMQVSNQSCATFTATVSGINLFSPHYYIYDSLNNLVADNFTGVFNNLLYGRYCAEIKDGCRDTTMRMCQTVQLIKTISVSASKTCSIGTTDIQVTFANPNEPYTINVYHPNGTTLYTGTSNGLTTPIGSFPSLPVGIKYKVVGQDNCGNKDSVLVIPDATLVTKSISVISKCPSAKWQDGSGNLSVNCNSNLYSVYPAIIKKNGVDTSMNYSANTGTNFTFSDLEPATYIMEYSLQHCGSKVYDTVTVAPYAYPNQSRSAIYQCNNNSFSLSAAVTGGVGPFEYEIMGSTPSSPSIVTPRQSSPVFAIDNGVTYSLIRLRTIDACGNAALNDISVLPLQNLLVRANTTCIYNSVTLSIDTVPNATYRWYLRRSNTDSTLVGDSSSYEIPFLEQEQIGNYVCKVSVNNDCITRLSYFDLTGDCGYTTLPQNIHLSGKAVNNSHQLSWTASDRNIKEYIIERKAAHEGNFTAIGKLSSRVSARNTYVFIDNYPKEGMNQYRLRIINDRDEVAHSNMISLGKNSSSVLVYPNPVRNELNVSISNQSGSIYKVELWNMAGQGVYTRTLNASQSTLVYKRTAGMKPGMYLLKVINTATGKTDTYKVLFE